MIAADSISHQPSGWEEVNGIVVPRQSEPAQSAPATSAAPRPVPRVKHYKLATEAIGVWRNDAPATASIRAARASQAAKAGNQDAGAVTMLDSVPGEVTAMMDSVADSAAVAPVYGMVVESPIVRTEAAPESGFDGMSWIFLGLAVLFCAVCLKFKSNTRYLRALMDDMTDVRMRSNLFDDTVRETSFLVLLNVMWVACAGVLLWTTLVYFTGDPSAGWSISPRPAPPVGTGICMGVAAVYSLFMLLAYWTVGTVFSDRKRTVMWVKGAAASQGIEAIFFFPLALLAMCYTPWTGTVLAIAAGVFLVVKIIFIYKGFRIFFNQISSWMLFLYYLCSLEIVPLTMAYAGALWLCCEVY